MNTSFRFWPEQASTYAEQLDPLSIFHLVFGTIITLVVFAAVVYLSLRYRRRSPDERPAPLHEPHWFENAFAAVMFAVFMVMFFWGARVYIMAFKEAPDALDIHVIGKQWMWKIQHPDGTREINTLHVPLGQRIQLTIASQDVIHSFYIPAFRIKQDAVPGRYTKMVFEPTKVGTYHLFCAEYCGAQHSGMIGSVIVMEPEKYQEWLAGTVPDESPSDSGARLFQQYGCVTCHGVQAPSLAGVFGRDVDVILPSGRPSRVKADEQYLRESILDSGAKVVAGYEPIMPSFRGQLSEEQLIQLVAYIKSLRGSQAGGPGAATQPAGPAIRTPDKTPYAPGPSIQTQKD
jgi:cytochrome c oxidase subunit 2